LKQNKVVIVGAGFSGMCMAIKLKEAGIDDFIVLEKAATLGGTWRENTYPGAECDIPSALYSYSFEHNSKWKHKWSKQRQIFQYQKDIAAKYQLEQHIQYETELVSAEYDQQNASWQIVDQKSQAIVAQHLVSAVGQLHHPSIPVFKDAELFEGSTFHSAKWNDQVDLRDKRVAVIGNAASAVQFIPEIASSVRHLTVFQRSANWILPKMDREYTRFEQWVSDKLSWITKTYRFGLWLKGEIGIFPAIRGNRLSRAILRAWSMRTMRKSIADNELLVKLIPDYPIGAKRILFADHYYPALGRENVSLETSAIERFDAQGIHTGDGEYQPFDVVIYATGFKTNPFLAPMRIVGENGQLLSAAWNNGAHAFLGVSTHGFPNLHMMYGPNTNLGHNSIIIMIEAQAKYIVQSIVQLDSKSCNAMSVKLEIEEHYNREIQGRLAKMAFSEVEHSWYMDGGKVTNNWVGGTGEYRRLLREVDWSNYSLSN